MNIGLEPAVRFIITGAAIEINVNDNEYVSRQDLCHYYPQKEAQDYFKNSAGTLLMKTEIFRYVNIEDLIRAAAEFICRLAGESARQRGIFTIALSGGKTPQLLYEYLSQTPYVNEIPWQQVRLFWGDERHVPAHHPDSNFAIASQAMINHVPIPIQNVYRIITENFTPEDAAENYQQTLRERFEEFASLSNNGLPVFDLVLLGIGKDGHTASLFPDSPLLEEQERWVAATPVPVIDPHVRRITLTFPVINAARNAMFLVAGAEKQPIVNAILDTPGETRLSYPAARVMPAGNLLWFIGENSSQV